MVSTYVQITVSVVVMATLITMIVALPPFEIRSRNTKSEGSEQWLRHLQRSKACHKFTKNHPTFVCTSTKMSSQPECVLDTQVCDDVKDCPKGEDEADTMCAAINMLLEQNENSIWRG